LGCPKSGICEVYKTSEKEIPCSEAIDCKKHLKMFLPNTTDAGIKRANYFFRIESMINVGCKFAPDDLSPDTWDGLIMIARERQRIMNLVDDQRRKGDENEKLPPEQQKRVAEVRKEMKIPPPGKSVFGSAMK